jgi:HlyD family secretion protein
MINNKNIRYASLIIAILLGLWWLSSLVGSKEITSKTPAEASSNHVSKPALTVNTVKPVRAMLSQNVAANGSIAAWQEAIIGAETSGLALKEVLVNVGDNVRHGQVLARFNDSTIQADLAQAAANVAESKAAALEAAGNANRARSIQDTGAISKQQVEQLLSLEASTQARLQAMQAATQTQQVRLKQTVLTAPDSGIISTRTATVGAVASSGQELFRLIRQGRLEWRAELTSNDVGKINPGMAANFTLPDGTNLTGKVRTTSPIVDSQTRNAIVFVDFNNPQNQAKVGMYARGSFVIGAKEALVLPATAVVMKDGFAYIMQVDAQKRVRQIKIQTGSREAGNVEIIGLEGNEDSDFVTTGGAFLADGDSVNVVQSNQKTTP